MASHEVAVWSVLVSLLIASAGCWIANLARIFRGQSLLTFAPRRHVPWGLIDLAIALVIMFAAQSAALQLLKSVWHVDLSIAPKDRTPAITATILLASSLATLAAVAGIVVLTWLRNGANDRDFGLDLKQVLRDLRLGLIAFVMLAAPVFLLQAILVYWWPSTHPLIELVKEDPQPRFFMVSAFSAMLVAPLAEELLFRVLLQGWLEKVAVFRGESSELFLGGRRVAAAEQIELASREEPDDDPSTFTRNIEDENPYAPPAAVPEAGEHPGAKVRFSSAESGQPSAWPIFASAGLFALMHYSHGPDPIPLFLLALGLGYVYHRTHRILPCIVVHFFLNSFSMGFLLVEVYFGKS